MLKEDVRKIRIPLFTEKDVGSQNEIKHGEIVHNDSINSMLL